jgi:hypothetical protein
MAGPEKPKVLKSCYLFEFEMATKFGVMRFLTVLFILVEWQMPPPMGTAAKWFQRFATITYHPWWLGSSSGFHPG